MTDTPRTAAVLLVIFGGSTHALIPLYAVGVFLSFTLSQASMVRRWLVRREPGWQWRWWLNAVGAATTGLVMVVMFFGIAFVLRGRGGGKSGAGAAQGGPGCGEGGQAEAGGGEHAVLAVGGDEDRPMLAVADEQRRIAHRRRQLARVVGVHRDVHRLFGRQSRRAWSDSEPGSLKPPELS